MFSIIAAAALPVLAVTLVLGGVTKLATAGGDVTPGTLGRLGPAVLVPRRHARPALVSFGLAEFALAAGLLFGAHPVVHWAPVAFFTIGTYVLWDLRRRRPDVGCGCFGEASAAPISLRSVGRTAMLAAMAASIAVTDTGPLALTTLSGPLVGWLAVHTLLLLAVSPEIPETIGRLRYRVPCEQRPVPASRALSRLRASTAWRTHAGMVASDEPIDAWRELCWRFFVFSTRDGAEIVFAVYLSGRRPEVRVAAVREQEQPFVRESVPASA